MTSIPRGAIAPIQIHTTEVQPIVVAGVRVLTLAMIDTIHQRPEGTAGRNFRNNRERLTEGEDYFKVCADEIRRRKILDIPAKATEAVLFITESGYLLLVKSFTDDLAWKIQKQLVQAYFRAGSNVIVEPSEPRLPVPTFAGLLGGQPAQLCDARALHRALGVGRVFATWITERIGRFGLAEGRDFIALPETKFNRRDFHLSVPAALKLVAYETPRKPRRPRVAAQPAPQPAPQPTATPFETGKHYSRRWLSSFNRNGTVNMVALRSSEFVCDPANEAHLRALVREHVPTAMLPVLMDALNARFRNTILAAQALRKLTSAAPSTAPAPRASGWKNPAEAEEALKSFRLKPREMYDMDLISAQRAEELHRARVIGPRQIMKLRRLMEST